MKCELVTRPQPVDDVGNFGTASPSTTDSIWLLDVVESIICGKGGS